MLIGSAVGAFILAAICLVLAGLSARRAKRAEERLQVRIDERRAADTLSPAELARLRALDWMLGGVAHDLNNALSVVLMNLDVMQQDSLVAQKHGRRLDGMFDSMSGASSLVRHLLNFSHSRRPAPEVISLAEALPPLIEVVQAGVGRDIAVKFASAETGPCCTIVDQASFEVAVVHLALQLAHAMRPGGGLVFDLKTDAGAAGETVMLSIAAMPAAGGAADEERGALDLEMAEVFARNAQGTLALAGNGERVVLTLPSCAATTTV